MVTESDITRAGYWTRWVGDVLGRGGWAITKLRSICGHVASWSVTTPHAATVQRLKGLETKFFFLWQCQAGEPWMSCCSKVGADSWLDSIGGTDDLEDGDDEERECGGRLWDRQ